MSSIPAKSLKSRTVKTILILSSLSLFLFMQGCSDIHTAVWNKAETTIDGHQITIRPCRSSYLRTKSDKPTDRQHIFGCGDSVQVELRNEALLINGVSYGMLASGDSIEVNHDKVFINSKEAGAIARN
jgi:hypothetical protein